MPNLEIYGHQEDPVFVFLTQGFSLQIGKAIGIFGKFSNWHGPHEHYMRLFLIEP
jgi:hypothetical protein